MTYSLELRYLESVEFRENYFVILYDRIFRIIKMREFEYQKISPENLQVVININPFSDV